MGHRANYTERLVYQRNKLYRVVKAIYKDFELDVIKQQLGSEDIYIRNLSLSYCGGRLLIMPTDRYKYTSEKVGIQAWYKCCCSCNLFGKSEMTFDNLIELINKTKYKDFSYTLKSLKEQRKEVSIVEVFNLLDNFTKDKRVELLVKANLINLALSKRFLELTKDKQKSIIKVAKSGKAPLTANINELLVMARTNCDYDLVPFGGDSRLRDYLLEQSEYLDYYKDYIKMAKKLHKNLNDNYWKYPKSLVEAHNKCVNEIRLMEEIKTAKKNEVINSKIKSIAKKVSCLNDNVNGYDIVVAKDLEDIKLQAETLSQCLITSSYYEKHANKKCLLVFIKKGDERLATAEMFYDKEKPLGQFYADERDRDNCKPNKEITNAFNLWLKNKYLVSNII